MLMQLVIHKSTVIRELKEVVVQVPERPGLFCETIFVEPGELVVPGIVETAQSVSGTVFELLISEKTFKEGAVKEQF